MTIFSEKIPFSRPKILMTGCLVVDQDFLIFPLFFQIIRIFTVLIVIYDPFFTRKITISENNSLTTPFFTLFVLSRASNNTISQNSGGTGAWAVHPTFGGPSPSPPRSPPLSVLVFSRIFQAYVARIISLCGLLTAGRRSRMSQNLEMRVL